MSALDVLARELYRYQVILKDAKSQADQELALAQIASIISSASDSERTALCKQLEQGLPHYLKSDDYHRN